MEKQILLPGAVKREMEATFKVDRCTLGRALKFERNSRRDKMLRAAATERGGLLFTGERKPKGFMPDVDTLHDHVGRTTYQWFGDRMEVRISKDTDTATVFIDGELVAIFEEMTTSVWGDMLYSLQQIYNQLNA